MLPLHPENEAGVQALSQRCLHLPSWQHFSTLTPRHPRFWTSASESARQLVTGRQCSEKAQVCLAKCPIYVRAGGKTSHYPKTSWAFLFSLVEPQSKIEVAVSILGLVQELLSFPAGRTLQGITISLSIYCLQMYFDYLFPRNPLLLEREGEIHSVPVCNI